MAQTFQYSERLPWIAMRNACQKVLERNAKSNASLSEWRPKRPTVLPTSSVMLGRILRPRQRKAQGRQRSTASWPSSSRQPSGAGPVGSARSLNAGHWAAFNGKPALVSNASRHRHLCGEVRVLFGLRPGISTAWAPGPSHYSTAAFDHVAPTTFP